MTRRVKDSTGTYRGVLTWKAKSGAKASDPLVPLYPQPPSTHALWMVVGTDLKQRGPYLRESEIDRLNLRVGDAITINSKGIVIKHPSGSRPLYDDLENIPAQDAVRPVFLTNPAIQDLEVRMAGRVLETVLGRIGYGQRIVIGATPAAGKTRLLISLGKIFAADKALLAATGEESRILFGLFGERENEINRIREEMGPEVEVWGQSSSVKDEMMLDAANLMMERVKRLMEAGLHVVYLLDSASRLAAAYNVRRQQKAKDKDRVAPGQGGVVTPALDDIKKYIANGRLAKSGGSLTIVCTALMYTSDSGDDRVLKAIVGTSDVAIYLQGPVPSNVRGVANLTNISYNRGGPAINPLMSLSRENDRMADHPVYSRDGYPPPLEQYGMWRAYNAVLKRIPAPSRDVSQEEAVLDRIYQDITSTASQLDVYQAGRQDQNKWELEQLKVRLNEIMDRIDEYPDNELPTWLMGRMRQIAFNGGPRYVEAFIKFLEAHIYGTEDIKGLSVWLAEQADNPRHRRNVQR